MIKSPLSENQNISLTVTLIVVSAVQFLTPFMASAVGVALPSIGRELGASAVELTMIQMTYILGVAIFLLPLGRFSDIHGRKKVFIFGIVLFIFTTLAIGWVQGMKSFILLRFLQGAGVAAIISTSFAILSVVFPAERRGRAMGIVVSCVYIGHTAGPTLGGIITSHLGWRWLFFLMVPIQLLALILTLFKLKGEWTEAGGEKFDWVGSLIYGAALSSLIVGVQILQNTEYGWVALLFGFLGILLFLRVEFGTEKPLLDVRLLLKNSEFTFGNLSTLVNYAVSFGVVFLFTLYLQYVKGMTAQHAGFLMVIQPCVQAIFSPISGRLSDSYSPSLIATFGMAVCTTGLIAAIFIRIDSSLVVIILAMVLLGMGVGIFASTNISAIIGSVESRHYGTASSMVATMRSIGQLISMTIITFIFGLYMGDSPVETGDHLDFMKSMHVILIVFSFVSVVAIVFLMRRNVLQKLPWKT